MCKRYLALIAGIIGCHISVCAQVIVPRFQANTQVPSFASVNTELTASYSRDRSEFIKPFRLESFGFDSTRFGKGYDMPLRMTPVNFAFNGLECPMCISRPSFERSRPSLPPFGGQMDIPFLHRRIELVSGLGGINATRPDDAINFLQKKSHYFDDNWLLQESAGVNVYLDAMHHIGLIGEGRYVENMGDPYQFGKPTTNWRSFKGGINLRFGR